MKRIVLMGAAVAGLFTAGITTAASAATSYRTKRVVKYITVTETRTKTETTNVPVKATCKLYLTTVAPRTSSAVTRGAAVGDNSGDTVCGSPLSTGFSNQSYTLNDAGDFVGKIQHWFKSGTIYGTYDLPQATPTGPPTSTTFGQAQYAGTVTFTGAGGSLSGTRGTAKLSCETNDSLHYTCTEKLSLMQPQTVATTVKVPVKKKVVVEVRVPA